MCQKNSQRYPILCAVGLRSAAPPSKDESLTRFAGQLTSREVLVGAVGAVAGYLKSSAGELRFEASAIADVEIRSRRRA